MRGHIDRVDLLPDGSACAIDYRLGQSTLNYANVFHGSSLQLLTYLLVLERHGHHLKPDGKLTPAAAFCLAMLRKIQTPKDILKAPSPDEPAFHLQQKPRGIFDLRIAPHLDKELTDGYSAVVSLYIKKDGSLGHTEKSDAVSAEELSKLMLHVERRIGEMADEIISGRIEIRPRRTGKITPCPRCAYRSLCRFEPSPGCYDDLPSMSRQEVLDRISPGISTSSQVIPSPGTPGEGEGGGGNVARRSNPHPNPPPGYQGRGQKREGNAGSAQ